jgi:hypothetical protein
MSPNEDDIASHWVADSENEILSKGKQHGVSHLLLVAS